VRERGAATWFIFKNVIGENLKDDKRKKGGGVSAFLSKNPPLSPPEENQEEETRWVEAKRRQEGKKWSAEPGKEERLIPNKKKRGKAGECFSNSSFG